MIPEFKAVDAHHHVWDLKNIDYEWLRSPDRSLEEALGDYESLRQDFLPADLISLYKQHGITKSVHVEAACSDSRAETTWLSGVAQEYGMPNAVVFRCELDSVNAQAELDWHSQFDLTRGVRMRSHPTAWRSRPFQNAFSHLVELGLSYEYNASPSRLNEAAELGMMFPNARIVIGHTGAPLQRGDEYFRVWRQDLRLAARAPNVHLKVSGLGMSDHSWTRESIEPWIYEALEIFSIDRCMWGSNWPVDVLYSSFDSLISAYGAVLAPSSASEQRAFFAGNAERFYQI